MRKNADHDCINKTRQNTRCIGNGFAAANLHLFASEDDRLAAQVTHSDIKRNAGAGRGLIKDHGEIFACKRPILGWRTLHASGFERFCMFNDMTQIFARNLTKIEKMTRRRRQKRSH